MQEFLHNKRRVKKTKKENEKVRLKERERDAKKRK